MSIRRRFVSALCLLSMGSTVVSGQQKNPFAEWDEIQKKTEATSSAATTLKSRPAAPRPGGITYFSPSAVESAIEAAELPQSGTNASPEAQPKNDLTSSDAKPLITERLKARPKVSVTVPIEEVALPVSQKSGVQRAALTDAVSDDEAVTQVSGVERPVAANSDNSNPFAELLKSAENGAADNPFSANQSAFDLSTPANQAVAQPVSAAVTNTYEAGAAIDSETGPQSPGVTLQWIPHGALNVGQACEVELQIKNTSRSTVRGVMAEAVIPTDLKVNSVTPQPTAGTTSPTWTLGELKAGEKRSVMFNIVPTHRGEVRLDAFVRLTGFSSSSFAVQEPMLAVAVDGPTDVEVGQQVTYTVRVSNPGTGVASNVMIQAAIPEGLEHRRGSLLTIEIGTLNPGESRQAQLIVTAVRGGSHDMAVRVLAEGGLLDQTISTVRIEEPRLNLQIAGPAEQMAGRTAEYALQVGNEGGVPSANVRAKYRVPDGFEFVSADRGGKFNEVDHSIEWFVGTVASGASSQFKVVLKANDTGAALHQAGVISEHGKVTMAEHATRVDGTAVLDLKIAASEPQLSVKDEVTYEIRITNSGTRDAENVGVSCELPSALELLSVAGPSEYIAENGIMVFKSLPRIEAGKSAVFAIRLRCNRDGNHRLRLRVASESVTEALIGEETAFVTAR